jgi:lipopolysaccharide export system protein LptC
MIELTIDGIIAMLLEVVSARRPNAARASMRTTTSTSDKDRIKDAALDEAIQLHTAQSSASTVKTSDCAF